MAWLYDDGGKAAADGVGHDCMVRATAIALQLPYLDVWGEMHELQSEFLGMRRDAEIYWRGRPRYDPSPAFGVNIFAAGEFMKRHGWTFVPGSDVPSVGRHVAHAPDHAFAVVDGVIHDISSLEHHTRVGSRYSNLGKRRSRTRRWPDI